MQAERHDNVRGILLQQLLIIIKIVIYTCQETLWDHYGDQSFNAIYKNNRFIIQNLKKVKD